MTFPSPVGGVAFPFDFAPSILFAILYGLLVPFTIYRALHRSSRTVLIIGTVTFSIERVVIFSLRAAQARNEKMRESRGLASYMQSTLALGFISIANDLVNILRCVLVNSTYGTDTYAQSPAATSAKLEPTSIEESESQTRISDYIPDHPRTRFWMRRYTAILGLAFLAATVPGIVGNSTYNKGIDDQNQANKMMRARYASSAVGLALILVLMATTLWAKFNLVGVSKRAYGLLMILLCLLSIPAIYRLSVMFHTTTSLTSLEPGSLNSPGAKAAFYVFHIVPELLTTVLLIVVNVRQTMGTGPFGDYRWRDETAKERARRERKAAEKAKKRFQQNISAP